MKIQILSDIHLEFGLREFHFTDADLLILAGDIHIGRRGFDYFIGQTRIICNPIGYADEPVIGAKENLIIEINQ